MAECLSCGKILPPRNSKYCNNKCQSDHKYKQYIGRWQAGEETGIVGKYAISNHIRRFLMEKYQNKCSRCGWNAVNPYTGNIPLEVEHIDGDYTNCSENNLDLICPNCHSLTATYKGANVGNGRKERAVYNLP